jgi:hypothetical protein
MVRMLCVEYVFVWMICIVMYIDGRYFVAFRRFVAGNGVWM